jgi:DNA-binding beta-propeller fold protein YncE
MPTRKKGATRRLLSVTIAVAVAGCSQSASVPGAFNAAPQPGIGPQAHFYGNDWVAESQPSNDEVVVYKRNEKKGKLKYFTTLSSGLSNPAGMVTTPKGQMYVANSNDSNVPVYRLTSKGPKGPIATLSDAGEIPTSVAASPNRELVAVSNQSTTTGGAASVSVYLNRQTTPDHHLTYGKDPLQGEGIAIDSNGNCYWSFNDPYKLSGSIVEYDKCTGAGVRYASGILDVGGVAVDNSGNVYFVDQLLGIWKCTAPNACGLFLQAGLGGLLLPRNINFDNSQPQDMWVSDAAGFIDAVNLQGILFFTLETLGGGLYPPFGIAPSPGG